MRAPPPLIACALAAIGATATIAQTESDAASGCAITGSPNVFVEGRAMLRLGDVAGCPGARYEIIQGVFVGGQPAVRLLPEDECATGGADSVFAESGQAARQGDAGACATQ